MEINQENKFKKLFKRYGVLCLACVFSLALALTIAYAIPKEQEQEREPVSTETITFALPMQDAVIVKDFADDRLQLNESLDRWEIHLAIDLTSEKETVFSIYDGVVTSVVEDALEGQTIRITHSNGFESVYSSLDKDVNVKEGDKVVKGQPIGNASDSASNEAKTGGHLHFTLFKDGLEVDPNNYLDLQNK